jgi:hypothetical protein
MLVKELPEDTNLTKVKVRLPESDFELFQNYAGGEKEMWIAGYYMDTFFLTPVNPGSESKKNLYPLPEGLTPTSILDWEVVENLN